MLTIPVSEQMTIDPLEFITNPEGKQFFSQIF